MQDIQVSSWSFFGERAFSRHHLILRIGPDLGKRSDTVGLKDVFFFWILGVNYCGCSRQELTANHGLV